MHYFQNPLKFVPANNRSPRIHVQLQHVQHNTIAIDFTCDSTYYCLSWIIMGYYKSTNQLLQSHIIITSRVPIRKK